MSVVGTLCPRRSLIALVVVCGSLLFAQAGAQAQAAAGTERTAGSPPSSSDDVARGLFQAGSAAYGAGHFEDALGYFQQAYELSQRPGFLYNIGQAADRLHRDELTVQVFRRYLELVPNSEHRTEVESRLRALERLVALNAEVQRAREQEASRERADATEPATHVASEPASTPVVPWVLIGAGGATLIAGGVFAWIGATQIHDVEHAADGSSYHDVQSKVDSGPTLATTGVVLMAAGAAAASLGVVWLLSIDNETASLAIGIQPGGLAVSGRL